MKITKKMVLTYSLLLILLSSLPSLKLAKAQESPEPTYKVLFLVSNAYGDNYYDLVGNFSQWGWELETAGSSNVVRGCVNHHLAYTLNCNLTFNDLNQSKIQEYDCLIIPSGGHWYSLVALYSVEVIVRSAHESGLIIGTLCIGQKVLSDIDGLMDGVKVAYFSMTELDMNRENARIVHRDVVSDKGFVTGGGGGGLSDGGYTVAPTAEFCETVKTALEPNNNTLIYSITGSIGGVLLLSIGILVVKNRHKIFSEHLKKTQQVKEKKK